MHKEDSTTDLVRRLLEAMIDEPALLVVEPRTLPGRVNWRVRPGINDAGKLVGKRGAHVKALSLIIGLMGRKRQLDWHLDLRDPEPGVRGNRPEDQPDARGYEGPGAASQLLMDVLDAILSGPCHHHLQICDKDVTFRVTAQSIADYETLVDPFEDGRGESLTLVAALGTIWRAIGRQNGANFRVEVPSR